mmetsp:Transcript_66167/g.125217  ORF Transcript_66167/g.125217 Transcript_66167/m.125217 type:complete len:208 (+) Transcript_66167:1669-2292(+)
MSPTPHLRPVHPSNASHRSDGWPSGPEFSGGFARSPAAPLRLCATEPVLSGEPSPRTGGESSQPRSGSSSGLKSCSETQRDKSTTSKNGSTPSGRKSCSSGQSERSTARRPPQRRREAMLRRGPLLHAVSDTRPENRRKVSGTSWKFMSRMSAAVMNWEPWMTDTAASARSGVRTGFVRRTTSALRPGCRGMAVSFGTISGVFAFAM